MPLRFVNPKFVLIADGDDFTIPVGFQFGSIYPNEGATFTVTGSDEEESGNIPVPYSFPQMIGAMSWAAQTVKASGGSVLVSYVN